MSAVERSKEALRELIFSGELKPGQKVSDTVLVERDGVSRSPTREALRALEAEGIITVTADGARVWQPAIDEVRDLYEYRALLEGFAAELAAQQVSRGNIAPAKIAELHSLADQIRSSENNRHERGQLNRTLHLNIATMAGNKHALRSYRNLWGKIQVISQSNLNMDTWNSHASTQHDAIIDAIANGQPDIAAKEARSHIQSAAEVYERYADSR